MMKEANMRNPRITKDTWRNATLDDWKNEFWEVYSRPDLARDLHQTWSMACEDASTVGEAIREGKLVNCVKGIAHTFCWVSSFVKKLECDRKVPREFRKGGFDYQIARIVGYKYPGICPHCLEESCKCPLLKENERESLKELQKSTLMKAREKFNFNEAEKWTVDRWQAHFKDIYDSAHHIRSLDELGFHLLEEMGEVEEVIRRIATWTEWKVQRLEEKNLRDLQEDLIEEVADTVSWCFSIVRKIAVDADRACQLEEIYNDEKTIVVTPDLQLSHVLWREYQLSGHNEIGCPVCQERPCVLGERGSEEIKWSVLVI